MHLRGIAPVIAVGNDCREYSLSIKTALMLGLMQAGTNFKDIGPALSPMAYFSQFHLDAPAVAMMTASHHPKGWTGVKMGFERPLTHGPDEMNELRDWSLKGVASHVKAANTNSSTVYAKLTWMTLLATSK